MRFIPYKTFHGAVLLMCGALCTHASAASIDNISEFDQAQLLAFGKNLSAATHYRSVSPPEPLGTIGFDVGLEASSTEIDSSLFDLATSNDFEGSELISPRVHVHKGLPFGFDVGASLSAMPQLDATVVGGELRYAFVGGGALTPAMAFRASYSQLQGVDDLSLSSSALEVGISKGILFFTPYAGIGIVRSTITPNNINGLQEETFNERKLILGATVNIGFALTLEADRTGDFRTYSAKVGVRF